jgi:hypothetical protein
MRELDKIPENEVRNGDVRDVIEVGKAKRKEKLSNLVDENTIKNRNAKALDKFAKTIKEKNLAREAERREDEKHNKQLEKQLERQKFLARSGIDEYSQKGRETKKREIQENIDKRNNKAVKIQKLFRGKQSRHKNYIYSDDKMKRFIVDNPNYDPSNKNPFDDESSKYAYDKGKARTLTTTERKAINYERNHSRVKKKESERKQARQAQQEAQDQVREEKIEQMEPNILFIDEDDRPLQERLSAAYPKKEKTIKRKLRPEQEKMREAWDQKQQIINDKANDEKEQLRQHQQHKTDIANYDTLMKMLERSNGGKTTQAMNNLIPYVYQSFGKNAGTNTNRKVSTVINQLKGWHDEKEAKAQKHIATESQLSAKKREEAERKKQAIKEDSRMRNPPKSKSTVHTVESLKLKEEKGGGGGVYNMAQADEKSRK